MKITSLYGFLMVLFWVIVVFLGSCEKKQPEPKPTLFDPQVDALAMRPLAAVNPEQARDADILSVSAPSGVTPAATPATGVPDSTKETADQGGGPPDAIMMEKKSENKNQELLEPKDPNTI